MSQHGTLGQTGCPGGEAKMADIIRSPLIHYRFKIVGFFTLNRFSCFVQVFYIHEPAIGTVVTHTPRILINHFFHKRNFFPYLNKLVNLLLIITKNHSDFHIVEQLGNFIRHGGLVDSS